jgi:hypothetical protein
VEKKDQKFQFLINNLCYDLCWGSESRKNRVHEKLQINLETKMLFSLQLLQIRKKYPVLYEK